MNFEEDLSPARKERRMTTSGTVSKAPLCHVSRDARKHENEKAKELTRYGRRLHGRTR